MVFHSIGSCPLICAKRLNPMKVHLGKVVYYLLCGERSRRSKGRGIGSLGACGPPQCRRNQEQQGDERSKEVEYVCTLCHCSMVCFVRFHSEAFITPFAAKPWHNKYSIYGSQILVIFDHWSTGAGCPVIAWGRAAWHHQIRRHLPQNSAMMVKISHQSTWSMWIARIEFIEKSLCEGEAGSNEDHEYFDLLPNI